MRIVSKLIIIISGLVHNSLKINTHILKINTHSLFSSQIKCEKERYLLEQKHKLPIFGVFQFSSHKTVLNSKKKFKKRSEKWDIKLGHLSAWRKESGHSSAFG